jgi:acetyl esterase/lipase
MKKYMLPILLLIFNLGCNSSDENNKATEEVILPAQDIINVSYGNDAEQKMDVYLPAGRNENTKVFILVHGGGWSGGSKADFNYVIPILKSQFPDHAIVNINYRLATAQSPAFPKQVQDIEEVVQFLKDSDYNISEEYAFIGASAGAHLAMLYSYKYDTHNNVKAVCNIVGPADFTDPYYTSNPYYNYAALYLVGSVGAQPEAAIAVSPALHVNTDSPATILFYGGLDPLVPISQASRLKAKLDQYNVYNEYYLYANGGHGNWNQQTMTDFQDKLINFFKERF